MSDLSVTYMGIKLRNPIIAGASEMTANLDSIKRLAEGGVGAIVTKSLFEEQIQLERLMFDEDLEKFNYRHAEMTSVFPNMEFAGPEEHLMWVRRAKQAVDIPVIASLNCVNSETWIEYAKLLEQTGVDALECNIFASPLDMDRTGSDIEDEQIDIISELKQNVEIPISLKLSNFYSNPLNVIARMDAAGVDAFVLFNRMFEPDLDVKTQIHATPFNFSGQTDYRLPLRYAGLLDGRIEADICTSTGILNGDSVVKMILAGATAVQTVTSLYRHGIGHVDRMLNGVQEWMNTHGYDSLVDFRGNLSQRNTSEPWAYSRAQYAKLLMDPRQVVENAPVG
ncbi:MAG: dihydroorotate dehydrogenase-like protein [Planctomycetota bacterium]|nr:dihydroorotate dehydrogenase-like protein [Planctomycetota bacterium]